MVKNKAPEPVPEEFREGIKPEFCLTEKQRIAVTLVYGLGGRPPMSRAEAAAEMGTTASNVGKYIAAARDKAADALCGFPVKKPCKNPCAVDGEDSRKMLEIYRGGMSKAALGRRYGVTPFAVSSAISRAEAEELAKTS